MSNNNNNNNNNDATLNVFCAITAKNGDRVPMELSTDSTARQVREKVSEATKIPLDQLRLIFRGKMIKDDDTKTAVNMYKLEPDCVLHCMGKPVEGGSPAATATTITATSTSSTTATAAVPSIPTTAAAASCPAAAAFAPPAIVDPLATALLTLRTSNPPAIYSTAISTLAKILGNIVEHPLEEKYRKVKIGNVAFQKKLGGLPGGDAAMKAVGFIVQTDEAAVQVYQLQASPDAWNQLLAHKATIDAAVQQAQQRSANTNMPNMMSGLPGAGAGAPNPFLGGMAGMPGMPPGGLMPPPGAAAAMNNPMMQSAMAEMMSNPEAMRNMLQNPMVQQMIQNDPNVSPVLRNSMQELANNPDMLNQMTQMMSDPTMRDRMMQSMGGAGGMSAGGMPGMMPGGMGAGGFGGAAMPPSAPSGNNNNNNNGSASGGGGGDNDQSQTEEEMIAEAIRRSLEES